MKGLLVPSASTRDVWRSYWLLKAGLRGPCSLCSAGSPCRCRWPSPWPWPSRTDLEEARGLSWLT